MNSGGIPGARAYVPCMVRSRLTVLVVGLGFVAASCSSVGEVTEARAPTTSVPVTTSEATDAEDSVAPPGDPRVVAPAVSAVARNQVGYEFPAAPRVDTGPPAAELVAELDALFGSLDAQLDLDRIAAIGASGDPRAAWLLSDLLRFLRPGAAARTVIVAFEELTGATLADDPVFARSSWQSMTDHLIAWDTPALPGYPDWKRRLFTMIEPKWEPFFVDDDAKIDWRLVSWGGVFIDDRPLDAGTGCPRGCIPALDDPAVTRADEGDWYPDDRLVFGVVVDGEARAYPKNIMEVHEMVNDTLGGRRIAIPYCTLCGSAQAYFTDDLPDGVEQPVLRTSGLLSRSNKVMYDLVTFSVLDTFTGEGLSGPLHDADVTLDQASVVTSTWGAWKQAHPDTTIVASDGGIGRTYDLDPLHGRDDNGPIFPVGDVDGRLDAQARVFGIVTDSGGVIAFDVDAARGVLDGGGSVEWHDIELVSDGSGVRAQRADGTEVPGHEAFWFAWSQFHPETLLWTLDR